MLQIQAPEVSEVGEIRRDLTGETIGTKTENSELAETAQRSGWDLTH